MAAPVNKKSAIKAVPSTKIGQILIREGKITEEILKDALKKASARGQRFGQYIVSEGLISEKDLAEALALQYGLKFVDLEEFEINKDLLEMVPEKIVKKYKIFPVGYQNKHLQLTTFDPGNFIDLGFVKQLLKRPIEFTVSPESQLRRMVERAYSQGETHIEGIAEKLRKSKMEDGPDLEEQLRAEEEAARAAAEGDAAVSIDSLINEIIENAMEKQASDIHIEPREEGVKIRLRVFGSLQDGGFLPRDIFSLLITKMKIISNLDIAEKRKPQDGSFRHKVGAKIIDLRISTIPTVTGEKACLRILDKSALKVNLDSLGMNAPIAKSVKSLVNKPYGIIFVTGPTGSGKTTTVYSTLNLIDKNTLNVVTIEDPVEYGVNGINQTQVNVAAGTTFASALRSILRQDPDVIMVGEIRDQETAEIAVKAALTGHLVISTLHTNDSIAAISRLVDMGIPPYLVAASVIGVLAQRLVRRICDDCKTEEPISEENREMFPEGLIPEGQMVPKPVGCKKCYNTGFTGRQAIFELMAPNDAVKRAISEEASEHEILDVLRKAGFKKMRENAWEKVLEGITTVEEVLKQTF